MSEQARLCGGCRHWGKPVEEGFEFRTCTAVVHDNRSLVSEQRLLQEWSDPECWDEDDMAVAREFRQSHKAAVNDGSNYLGCLRTREDFGCVLWEAKG